MPPELFVAGSSGADQCHHGRRTRTASACPTHNFTYCFRIGSIGLVAFHERLHVDPDALGEPEIFGASGAQFL